MQRMRRAGTGTSSLFATLVSVSVLLVVAGLIVILPTNWHVQDGLDQAALAGAHVAALTENDAQVRSAVEQTLRAAKLPTTYHGHTLFTVDSTSVVSGPQEALSKVTVHYQAPILFPNLFAVVGMPNSLPFSIPRRSSASFVNETYFGGGS